MKPEIDRTDDADVNDDLSLAALIRHHAVTGGQAPFLEDARSDRQVDYWSLAVATDRIGHWLDWSGVGPGEPILIDIDDPIINAVAFLGVLSAGRCAVPIDPQAPAAGRRRLVERARPRAQLTGQQDDRNSTIATLTTAEITAALAGTSSVRTGPRVRAAGAVRLHTSGSTGAPKAVHLDEGQLLHTAAQVVRQHRLTGSDRGYNPLPLFHINAEVVGLLATLIAGATLILDRRFHRHGFWQLIRDREATWINGVPAIWSILATADASAGDPRVPAVRFLRSASAPLPELVRRRIEERTGVPVLESYGMTEAASQIAVAPIGEPTPAGSCGRPVGVQLQIRDRGGRPVPTGETGAVWIRGRSVITGFVDGIAADRFDAGGWLDTGDLGRLDANGFLFLAGRSDDVINRGGELVHPREVEEVLLADPAVAEAVLVGRPDPTLGEVPIGYVLPVGEPPADLDRRLLLRCADELSRFQRPVEIHIVSALPRGSTGKVQRRLLRAAA